jgi:hypothetical protein
VDALAVMSYSDAIQIGAPQYWGSILAHGICGQFRRDIP